MAVVHRLIDESGDARRVELELGLRELMNEDKWQLRDAQLPKSLWWLSDGAFAGVRVVMETPDNKR